MCIRDSTMADRMAVMNGGYLQQYDSPAQVFAHPVNMFCLLYTSPSPRDS